MRERSPTIRYNCNQETAHIKSNNWNEDFVEISRRSSSSESNSESNRQSDSEMASVNEVFESYEETLERHRKFFDDRPLMRCLDADEEQLMADLLYERLLNEVKQDAIEILASDYRGELQVRAFWANVRKQLQIDEDDDPRGNYWPEGYPHNTEEEEDSSYKTWVAEDLTTVRDEEDIRINREAIQVHVGQRDRSLSSKLYSALKFGDGSFRPYGGTRISITSSRSQSRSSRKNNYGSIFR